MPGSANSLYDAKVAPTGGLRVFRDPFTMFIDTYDGVAALDTTNKYTLTSGGSGSLPSNVGAAVTLNAGATLNGFSNLQTQTPFRPRDPAYILVEHHINLPAAPQNGYAFWGLASTPASPTIANPLVEAAGFELFTDGHLYAVTYQTNVRGAFLVDLTALGVVPTGTAPVRFFMLFRGDSIKWAIGSLDNVVAEMFSGAPGPNSNTLPKTILAISNGGATSITDNNATVSDTSSSEFSIADANFGWRTATVGAQGGMGVSLVDGFKNTYSASVTGLVGVAGDIFILNGSATKTIRVTRVEFSGTATAAASSDLQLIKRSTADTAGTAAAATPHDANDAAATAAAQSYTAAPTPGTAVGTPIRAVRAFIPAANGIGQNPVVWDFGTRPAKAPTLRGVAQGLALNIGATNAGALYDISYEWTEE